MSHLDLRHPLEQFAAQMQRGAVAGRSVGDLALVLVAISDELLDRFRGRGIRHAHQVGLGDQPCHRREVADGIVAQRRIQELVGGQSRANDEDRVAIRIRMGDHIGRNVAAGAGLVLHHHRLAPNLLQAVADETRGDIG